ncbi:hypothetical protein L9F63_018314 [Diploptera punctata]|uniref:Uncharacterized protein n=1 Tax=Diploptera punctata TaxID=6984 RepID=A0AAD7ZXP7_DIPPU|nr:hypothetical protein L9F63_018314 [Diploptera punctata]
MLFLGGFLLTSISGPDPEIQQFTDRSKKKSAKKRHNTGRPEATDDGDKLRNCNIEEKGYEVSSSKYRVHLSSQSMMCLQKYLSQHGHVILMQVLQTWFDLEIGESFHLEEEEEETESPEIVKIQTSEQNISNRISHSETDLQELEEVIRQVREGPPSPSPLLLYTISNTDGNVACGRTWGAVEMLGAGFGSEVKLWSLVQNKMLNSPCPNVSKMN